jgi:hypothetical protein
MFSASLLTVMVHSLPPQSRDTFVGNFETPTLGAPSPIFVVPTSRRLAEQLEQVRVNWSGEWPMLPVVGRLHPEYFSRAMKMTKQSISSDQDRGFVWGRIPLDDLIRHYSVNSEAPPDEEYIDLGTPVWAASASVATGSTANITNLLKQTPASNAAAVGAALVDLGTTPAAGATNVPRTFGNKLRHVTYPPGTNIDLSTHAEEVLEVLLDRLNTKNMLSQTTVSMSLIDNPRPDQIRLSKGCFEQHCAPELLSAVQAINNLLNKDKLSDDEFIPTVVNMSVGTHVGPHNGQSPLEIYISGSVFKPERRFPFAAAGNEGIQGISSRLRLKQNEADYMDFVATETCTDLLIEFWWDEAKGPADMEIVVGSEASGMRKSVIPINAGTAGPALVASTMGQRRPVTFLTLCQSTAQGTMGCIAFAITRPPAPAGAIPLPKLHISFDITAKSSPSVIHAWTVFCDAKRESGFVRGGPEGSVCVPASDPNVVSVAAYDPARKQMWRSSSRGPASQYDARIESPMMAHLSNHPGGHEGTSFASPRAAADATVPLAQSGKRTICTEPKKLIEQAYGTIGTTFDPRYGFSKQIT